MLVKIPTVCGHSAEDKLSVSVALQALLERVRKIKKIRQYVMIWQISKEFDFCYGHRVWSQQLDSEFSLTGCLACRHLHGTPRQSDRLSTKLQS